MIRLERVTLAVPGRTLVRDIGAAIERGEFVCVLGPNGVGKTTLLRAISGLQSAAAGTIVVDGIEVASMTPIERARHLAFVTSDDVLTESLRVSDVVAMGRFPYHAWWEWRPSAEDEAIVARALDTVRMRDYAGRLLSTLSSGERQRVWIALGLAQSTPVLLLDEPTSHLDVRVAHEILALLRDLAHDGRSVVCVMHDLNDAAAYADRLLLLGCEKLLAFDVPGRVLTPELVRAAYGVSVERLETADGPRVFARPTVP
jgi:iron complex transport system ATP-binding protein